MNAKEIEIHDKGLVSVLKQIHDELDAAVLEAYGWSDLLKWGTGGPPVISSAHGQAARAPLEAAAALEPQLLCRLVALNHERVAEEMRGLIRWLRPDYQAPGAAEHAERLTACFGRKNRKRTEQIAAILDTLRALGHIA